MYTIYKITSNPVVDFAAEELKRYLRMMMPRCGEIPISYAPEAKGGFRLGLMQDFGLDTSEAEDVELDDILHIDADENGGIIAGDNPRSVLLAVYKYLTINGCRWLMPGVDGEFIPLKTIEPVKYHKMADCRYRGQCNEGAESQQAMLETIDYAPKIGMNVYMLEFDIPSVYYDWYYNHKNNEANREPEPISLDTVLQWKRACETEMAKRGLQFHDMGHGWTADSFGINSAGGWSNKQENAVPEEMRQYIALVDGKRDLCKGVALNTNFCMSNAKAREIVTKTVCDYAQNNHNVDYLHVWLADWQKNMCECDECRKKIPSDWYVVLLNDIDAELTRRGLDNRIGVCIYSETAYEPTCEYINNPKRFVMILGAITRSYTYSMPKDPQAELTPFVLNKSGRLDSMEEHMVRLRLWKNFLPAPAVAYEYHFWKHQYFAPGVLCFARRLYEDVLSYRENGLEGIIEDGSQRSFFPNGLCFYVYAQTLFDNSVDYDALVKDYFDHTYGEAAPIVMDFLKKIDALMPQSYVEARHSIYMDKTKYYRPELESQFLSVEPVTRALEEALQPYKNMPYRTQTVAVRLMLKYAEYCRNLGNGFAIKCVGKDEEAKEFMANADREFGKYEIELERYYDHTLSVSSRQVIFNAKSKTLDQ